MNMYEKDKFGVKLKMLRKQRGITQENMAHKINASRSCISNYESGNRQPDNETIKLIADYFDVSVDYLLGRSAVKTVLKSESLMTEVHEILSSAENSEALDLSNAPTHVKCEVAEFYEYLLKKEKNKKKVSLY